MTSPATKEPCAPKAHEWRWETPPIGPDWRQCRTCDVIEVECVTCGKTMPEKQFRCFCGKRRAPNQRLFAVAFGPAQ